MKNEFEFLLQRKQLELNALLEITKSLNQNHSDEELYRIFGFIVRTHLGIQKLALYSIFPSFSCRLTWGLDTKISSFSEFTYINKIKETVSINEKETNPFLKNFNFIIPVSENNQLLSLLFIRIDKSIDKTHESTLDFLTTLSQILVTAIDNRRLQGIQLEKKLIEKDLELAVQVQHALIPKNLPVHGKITASARYIPHKSIGGDYYDFIELDDEVSIVCIADVSGKGIPAAIIMAVFQATFRTLVAEKRTLKEIVSALNSTVFRNAEGERFVSFFVAQINGKNKTMQYINAGHNPPIFFSSDKTKELENGTTLLGVFNDLPFINAQTISINSGDFIFLYTDGVSEATNKKDEFFGTGNIKSLIAKNCKNSADAIITDILRALTKFCQGNDFADDVAMLGIKIGK